MDIGKLMGMFGFGADDLQKVMDDPGVQNLMQSEQMQQLLQNPNLSGLLGKAGEIAAQGGIMPDDVDSLMENAGGMDGILSGMSDLFGTDYDEIDLDEEVAAYDPAAEDAADRKFVAALKEFIKASAAEIPEQDVCAFELGYHAAFTDEPEPKTLYELWISYDTEKKRAANRERFGQEVWNWINWANETFRMIDDAPFSAWRQSQGYDEENDGDDMIARIYDLAAVAVMELHAEKFTEQKFGRKLPFVIGDFEYDQKTAIRAVKANGGTELFDQTFFADCGFSDDDEEA